jgi:hypothetical protein
MRRMGAIRLKCTCRGAFLALRTWSMPSGPKKLAVRTLNAEMFSMLTEPWSIEFYDLVTPEKLKERNVS